MSGVSEQGGARSLRVAVVGGGMAGLGAARVLEDARAADPSIDWQLYETDERFGGKVYTRRRDGFVVEGGPDSAIIEKHWPITMARRLGIGDRFEDSNESIRKSFVYARGRLHELPEGIILMVPTRMVPFAMSGLMSWPGKLRMGMDLVLPRGGGARAAKGPVAAGTPDESLGDFVRRRLGREALDRIAEPIVAGIHAGDPEKMSVRATFPMFLDMEKEHRSLILAMLKRRKARQKAAAAKTGGGPAPGAPGAPRGAAGGSGAPGGPRSYFYSFKGGLQDLSDALVASLPAERLHGGVEIVSMAPCGAGCGTSGAGSAPTPCSWPAVAVWWSTPWCWRRRPGPPATCFATSRPSRPPTSPPSSTSARPPFRWRIARRMWPTTSPASASWCHAPRGAR